MRHLKAHCLYYFLLIVLVFQLNTMTAYSYDFINATNSDLTQTTEFRDLGYANKDLGYLILSVNNPYDESEAVLNLHVNRKEPTQGGFQSGYWMIDTFSGDTLVGRDVSTSDGDNWVALTLPTGSLEAGFNNISLLSRKWNILLLRDSTITLKPSNKAKIPGEMSFEELGFQTTVEPQSTIHFNTNLRNSKGKLKLHYSKIDPIPQGFLTSGNWDLKAYLNEIDIGGLQSTSEGEEWKEIEITSGIMDDQDNTLVLKSFDWPIIVFEDSKLIIEPVS
jgi:hypothetical protein